MGRPPALLPPLASASNTTVHVNDIHFWHVGRSIETEMFVITTTAAVVVVVVVLVVVVLVVVVVVVVVVKVMFATLTV